MGKICLINQPSGLGDIMFCQKINRIYMEKGYHIIHPVIDDYLWIGDYIRDQSFPNVNSDFPFKEYFAGKEIIEIEDFMYLPLINCTNLCRPLAGYIMDQHYRMLNVEWKDWPNYLSIERNLVKEDALFYDELGLKDGERYNFINKMYQPRHILKTFDQVAPSNELRNVEIRYIDGFTMFDWSKVIENAENLYMVDTSLCYLVEILNLKAKECKLWPRNPITKFIELKPVFNFPWEYVE